MNLEKELVYQCIRCKVIWRFDESKIEINESNLEFLVSLKRVGVSSGICPICFRGKYIESVRASQRKEGYFDCFLRRNDSCNSDDCRYKSICQDSIVDDWQSKVIATRELTAYL